ncbi:hypothetical protein [Streptomyces sp. NPDC086787]|uniref:hypothetical protein n=1 Tax=Streptomyces sp. NPDC086787 TaxID=3365759 RepID=UPI00380E6955
MRGTWRGLAVAGLLLSLSGTAILLLVGHAPWSEAAMTALWAACVWAAICAVTERRSARRVRLTTAAPAPSFPPRGEVPANAVAAPGARATTEPELLTFGSGEAGAGSVLLPAPASVRALSPCQ